MGRVGVNEMGKTLMYVCMFACVSTVFVKLPVREERCQWCPFFLCISFLPGNDLVLFLRGGFLLKGLGYGVENGWVFVCNIVLQGLSPCGF